MKKAVLVVPISILILAAIVLAVFTYGQSGKEEPSAVAEDVKQDDEAQEVQTRIVSSSGMAAGVFSLGPSGIGMEECSEGLCKTGEYYESLESTWANPDVVGVYVRLPWDSVHTDLDTFDFTTLDHELNKAVEYNKYVSLSFSAGNDDIPEWIFTEGGVTPYEFQDGGSNLEPGQCGTRMTLGDPTDEEYQKHYFDLIRAAGEHIQSEPEWLDSLAYFKISGANLYTHEFRLPNNCDPACEICNTEVWAEAGYTPEGIYQFVLNQMDVIQEVLPGKPMVYQLIQDGLPWINNEGDYLQADGTSSGDPVLRSVEQVEEIIRRGSEAYGPLFVVAHNGLGTMGRPNRWVINAGEKGQPTGFQTKNLGELSTPEELQMALENLWENTTAHYIEAYEQLIWEIGENGNELVPDSEAEINTLEEWNQQLQSRVEN